MGKRIILLYHRIGCTKNDYNRITVEERNFCDHMMYLKEKCKVVSLEDLLAYEGDENVVAVTFDDGFADFYGKAMPIAEKLQIPVTVFVTTGRIDSLEELWTTEILRILFTNTFGGKKITVDICGRQIVLPIYTIEQRAKTYKVLRHVLMQLSAGERETILDTIREQLGMSREGRTEYHLMSTAECRKAAENPLITIGAHTVSHASLGRIDEKEMVFEIQESIRNLECILGQKIKYFAYPFGERLDYSDKAVEVLRQSGIVAACAVEGRVYDSDKDSVYKIPRLYVGNWKLNDFQNKLDQWISGQGEAEQIKSENLYYIGSLDADVALWNSDRNIVIWGTGVRGRKLYTMLCHYGQMDRIFAFGDNNPEMWNQKIDNIPVWSPEQIRQKSDIDILLYNTYDIKLFQQLTQSGFTRIHWII